ncbi:MAG: archease [Planctomycetia bacterium]|nr:archease [Planctomycetia bacterium]
MHEVFEHTADLGLRVQAPSLEVLFAEAGVGLFEIIAGDVQQIRPRVARSFEVAGTDPVWLLLDWTTELLAAFGVEKMLFREFAVTVHATGLRGTARGEPYDPAIHTLAHEIKAVTQHELDVHRTAAGWEATLIVDI